MLLKSRLWRLVRNGLCLFFSYGLIDAYAGRNMWSVMKAGRTAKAFGGLKLKKTSSNAILSAISSHAEYLTRKNRKLPIMP